MTKEMFDSWFWNDVTAVARDFEEVLKSNYPQTRAAFTHEEASELFGFVVAGLRMHVISNEEYHAYAEFALELVTDARSFMLFGRF